jgi:hypothetical protein
VTSFSLGLSPFLPQAAIVALVVAGIAVALLGLLARRPGALIRTLGIAIMLFALADPSFVREDRQGLKDVVAVVIDRSESQSIGERKVQTDAAAAEIGKRLAGLGNVETRIIEAGAHATDNRGTRLFEALSAGLADVPPERVGAVIMVTDGVVHDIPTSPEALGFRAPLHVLVTGHEGERDRRIELVEAPRFGIVGKTQKIVARVLDTGASSEPVIVRARRDGADLATLEAIPGVPLSVEVPVDHAGPNVVELEVAGLPDELTLVNNKAVVTIEGVRDKLKVLLVSGEPNADERTWRNLLKSDPNVDLVHFTILRPPDKQDGTPINELALIAFPTNDLFGKKIADFDLIIFDRYSDQTILPPLYFDNIVRYVRKGGALLIGAGPDFAGSQGLFSSPLETLTPAKPDGRVIEVPFRPIVTDEGAKHPVTRDLSGAEAPAAQWGRWFRQVGASLVKGTPVMAGQANAPLLILSREDKGRVALLLSDQIWLWARGYEGGGPYVELLRRLAHWLMKEPDLEEEALRASVRGREIAIERQSVKSETSTVTVTSPTGAHDTVTLTTAAPGLSRAIYPAGELGLYRLTDGALSVLANVGPENPIEFQDVLSTLDKLKPLAVATGGGARRLAGAGGAIVLPRLAAMYDSPVYSGDDFIAVRRTQASELRGIGVLPMAIGFLGLALLLGGILVGWLVEGRRFRG